MADEKKHTGHYALTGGGEGALDARDGALCSDGDKAFVITSSYLYVYQLDADSGLDEDSPKIIAPDSNAGTKRWILIGTTAPEGTNTGDIIRYNATTDHWESCAEPLEFSQIILTPRESPVSEVEGAIYYKSTDNGVYVATE